MLFVEADIDLLWFILFLKVLGAGLQKIKELGEKRGGVGNQPNSEILMHNSNV